jgi:predicted N-acyltransferase
MQSTENAHFEAKPDDTEVKPQAEIRVVTTMSGFDEADWNALTQGSALLRHSFLHALETSGCVGADIGWEPIHLGLFRDGKLAAAMPLYVKHHSWGEFVFDFAWADAYRRQGLRYYPKLVNCVPFSPVPGPRLLAHNDTDKRALIDAAQQLTHELGFSSFHSLFPTAPDQAALGATQLLHRSGFQYHWDSRPSGCNVDYASFDAFLAEMTHDKRKKIRQERRKLETLGVRFRWVEGTISTPADWDFFMRCYADTYARHRSEPHLNRAFFDQLIATQPETVLLIIAERDGVPVACSLCLMDGKRLYGRHWGTLEYIPGLHFETCYYQGIEYAIAHGLDVFEGGAQGEHKLARGLTPVTTHSYHWLEDAQFRTAVDHFLQREEAAISHYIDEMEGPFRKPVE